MSDEVLLEGPRIVRQALAAGVHLEVLALREGDAFAAAADRTVVLSRGLFRDLSQTQTPQGVLAVGRARLSTPAEAVAAARAAGWPLVVLDGVQDPGNVGAIARSAAAAGAPALAVLPGTADPFGAKAIRASAGHVFNLVVAEAGWVDLEGLRCIGASAAGTPIEEADLGSAGALVLGSEAHGLSREVETVALPMAPRIESLNVAAAAAILLYEVRRRISR
ncbi:MAG: RNA methyltransferase [Candidatus Dormibacteraeota bacterium]|nr:RNA methyltransferase [Candidatus Dormibacteraeota bacterium]